MKIIDKDRDWRAPIAAGAYLLMAVAAAVLVTLVLGYFLFVRPIEHTQQIQKQQNITLQSQNQTLNQVISTLQNQAFDRQKDTNAIAGAICTQRIRQLVAVRDPRTPEASRKASMESADALFKFLSKLSPHPPTKCKGVDPYP